MYYLEIALTPVLYEGAPASYTVNISGSKSGSGHMVFKLTSPKTQIYVSELMGHC